MGCCKVTKGTAWHYTYLMVLPFLHVHHVKQFDFFVAKSEFEYSVDFPKTLQSTRFIYMITMLLVQTIVDTD